MNISNLFVYHLNQDDPKKCTALKLVRFGLVKKIDFRHIRRTSLVLNPLSTDILSKSDANILKFGLVVIDCSWKKGLSVFTRTFPGKNKRLPILQAGNPINYSKIFTLSSAEAIAASLFILGHRKESEFILSKFKWGNTFFQLNTQILDAYSRARDSDEIAKIEKEYYKKFL